MPFVLCDDLMELVGREVVWVRDRERWVRFWKRLVWDYIDWEDYAVDSVFDKGVLKAVWFHWKLQLWNKYETKADRWEELCV